MVVDIYYTELIQDATIRKPLNDFTNDLLTTIHSYNNKEINESEFIKRFNNDINLFKNEYIDFDTIFNNKVNYVLRLYHKFQNFYHHHHEISLDTMIDSFTENIQYIQKINPYKHIDAEFYLIEDALEYQSYDVVIGLLYNHQNMLIDLLNNKIDDDVKPLYIKNLEPHHVQFIRHLMNEFINEFEKPFINNFDNINYISRRLIDYYQYVESFFRKYNQNHYNFNDDIAHLKEIQKLILCAVNSKKINI